MPDQITERVALVLFGAAITWCFQQYRVLRSEDAAILNEHIKDVEKYRDSAMDYWLHVVDKKAKEDITAIKSKDLALAARVRATHSATTTSYDFISNLTDKHQAAYKSASRKLYELATGGSFESQRTEIEPARALMLYDAATDLIRVLREIRREVVSIMWIAKRVTNSIRRGDFKTLMLCLAFVTIVTLFFVGMLSDARPETLNAGDFYLRIQTGS